MAQSQKSNASQDFVPIQEIRNGVVVGKDKSLHIILMASSLNFALKSQSEQEAIIAQYQNYLNSLDFSMQFFIQSRKLDIDPYLSTLQEALTDQTVELIQIQTREYIDFVKNFVKAANIVSKTFYVVVSYTPPLFSKQKGDDGIFSQIKSIFSKQDASGAYIPDETFEEYQLQLWQRVNVVTTGLGRAGVRLVPLNTEEAIELYYELFNPGETEKGNVPQIQT